LLGLIAALLVVKTLGDVTVLFVVGTVTIPWLILSALSVDAYRVVHFDACPDLDDVWLDHADSSVKEIKWTTAKTLKSFFDRNVPTIEKKAKAVSVGIWCLVAETGVGVAWLAAIAWGLDL